MKIKQKCEGCGMAIGESRTHKGRLLCFRCYRKTQTIIGVPSPILLNNIKKMVEENGDI